ncbi:rhomboid family-domain-containing protein [Gongronella butleri]|nr:rhomboid family-domain-containing protein [Gongronella butleri]
MDTEQQQNLKKDEATSLANASPRPPHDNFDNGAHRLPTSNTPQPSSLHHAYRTPTPYSQAPWPQPYDDRRRARLCSFPLFSYMVAMMMAIMLIYEFVQFKSEFGAVLNLSPFNMMLGPNAQTLIRTGAFFPPCMRISENLPPTQMYPCPNASNPTHLSSPSWVYALPATQGGACPLQNVCGLTPFRDAAAPDQAYRIITALVNSAGIVQFIINITFLLSFGATTEKQIGTIRYIYVFLVSGTFGYCFASVFVRDVALMGCLGAIYGVAASYLMDCFRSWERSPYPAPSICKFLLIVVLGAIAGYLPGASNFCHMGGLLGGLLADWSVSASQARLRDARLMWSLMMVFRLVALAALIVLFYITLSNFYSNHSWAENCLWCHYVSCLPFFDACSSL